MRPGRAALALVGIAAAAAMVSAAATLAYSLSTGFDRTAARANLPDVLATFDPEPRTRVQQALTGLVNVSAASLQVRHAGVHVSADGNFNGHATVIGVESGPHGYLVASGRDVRGFGEVVVEAGLARSWHLRLGEQITVGEEEAARQLRIVGTAVTPEDVAFPLAGGPHLYLVFGDAVAVTQMPAGRVDAVGLWLADRRYEAVTLAQARSAAFGVTGLQFVTRTGLRLSIAQAGGIVVTVLIAFSLIALAVAGTMLAASSAAEVQRRLEALGLLRAVGASRREIVTASAVEACCVAAPAAAIGTAGGWLAVGGPTDRLLASLNELGPGWSVAPILLAAFGGVVAIAVAATALPTWRALRRPATEALHGGDVVVRSRMLPLPAGPAGIGLRLVLARPWRSLAAALVIGAALAVVLVILTIASVLQGLNAQPLSVGKRYQLLVDAPAAAAATVARLPGVAGAAPRYQVDAADSFDLGEPFQLIAFSGDHTGWEDPALLAGRRVHAPNEAEVGLGLAQALSLSPGAVLAAQLPSGREVRFHVVGIVQAYQAQGRLAYVQPFELLQAEPSLPAAIAVRLRPGASSAAVTAELARRGFTSASSGGIAGQSVQNWATRSSGFLAILVALLRAVAVLNAAVCLYAVAQALALIVHERRQALAVVRSNGADRLQMAVIFGSGALLVVLAALLIGLFLERAVVGPGIARIAASYVVLALGASVTTSVYTGTGLVAGTLAVAVLTARLVTRRPLVEALRQS